MTTVHEVRLAQVPARAVCAEDFEVAEAGAVPELTDGHVLVGIRRLGLNAGLANRIGGSDTAYGPGIGVGDVPASDAVVEVLASKNSEYQVGELAVRTSPWRDVDVAVPDELRWMLRVGFFMVPVLFGLDKFAHVMTDWDKYLAPWFQDTFSPFDTIHQSMYAVGGIEIFAGVVVLLAPRVGAYGDVAFRDRAVATVHRHCATS